MAWSEEKKRAEVKKLLFFIYKEWRKDVTENMIDDWLVVLKGVRRSDVRLAALLLRRQKTYGEPKTQDLFDCIERVQKAKENFRSIGESWIEAKS